MLNLPAEPDWNYISTKLAEAAGCLLVASIAIMPRDATYERNGKSGRDQLVDPGLQRTCRDLSDRIYIMAQRVLENDMSIYRSRVQGLQTYRVETPGEKK